MVYNNIRLQNIGIIEHSSDKIILHFIYIVWVELLQNIPHVGGVGKWGGEWGGGEGGRRGNGEF